MSGPNPSPGPEKIVINTGSGQIKGYLEAQQWNNVEDLLRSANRSVPDVLRVRHPENGAVDEIPVTEAKAIFFVNTFEGKKERDEVRFHRRAPIVHGVWVQVEFQDGEIMEGIIHNSMHHLTDKGFFLVPTDPESNNKLVYVLKKSLRDYRVLGVRPL